MAALRPSDRCRVAVIGAEFLGTSMATGLADSGWSSSPCSGPLIPVPVPVPIPIPIEAGLGRLWRSSTQYVTVA